MGKHKLTLFAIIFYVLFSFKQDIPTFEGNLFANDFSEEGVAEWLIYSCLCYSFLIFIGAVGLSKVQSGSDKVLFMALIIDGVISIFSYVIFGFHSPQYLSVLINSIPLGIIIYSQYIHGKLY
jgi:hypothetical protein